jgi:hypothetical protein
MKTLQIIGRTSIACMLVIGFFKILILDKFLLDWSYYLTANLMIRNAIVILTIIVFSFVVVLLFGVLFNKPKK